MVKNLRLLAIALLPALTGHAQTGLNTITTATPFVVLPTNPVQMGMGNLGVVSSGHYTETAFLSNAALLASGHRYMAANVNYSPWLRARVPDMNLTNVLIGAGISKLHAVGLRFTHFNSGQVNFTDVNGNLIGQHSPTEFLIQVNYAARLNNGLSLGIAHKFIYSDLSGGINLGGYNTYPGIGAATDFGLNYRGIYAKTEQIKLGYSVGFGLNNIGSKINYMEKGGDSFLPMNMQLGVMLNLGITSGAVRFENDLGYQIEKLLVPTPPIYDRNPYIYVNGQQQPNPNYGNIVAGTDPNVSIPAAIFQSFADAPGGTTEEWHEVMHMVGHEFRVVFNDKYSAHVREGFFFEHETKGGRQFVTLGGAVGAMGFRFDFAYVIPTRAGSAYKDNYMLGLSYRMKLGTKPKLRFPPFDPKTDMAIPATSPEKRNLNTNKPVGE